MLYKKKIHFIHYFNLKVTHEFCMSSLFHSAWTSLTYINSYLAVGDRNALSELFQSHIGYHAKSTILS